MSRPRPSLLMVTPSFAPELTGVGRYAGELAAALSKRGYAVEVVCPPPYYPGWYVRPPYRASRYGKEKDNGLTVWRCPIFVRRGAKGMVRLASSLSFGLTSAPILMWRIVAWRPDIVLCVEPTMAAAPIALIAARLVGARLVLHVQDIELDAALAVGHFRLPRPILKLARSIERFVKSRFDQLVTISSTMRSTLIAKGLVPGRVSIIRNWVDTSRIRPLNGPNAYREELAISHDAIVCLYAGQIGRKQALHLMLEAAERAVVDPRLQFVVAGDGPELPELKRRYEFLANVQFIPLQPEERLCELLALADIHILPQDAGVSDLVLPSKLGGMLASGRQIVVTAACNTELAQFLGHTVEIVEPGDADALLSGINSVISRPDVTQAQRLALAQSISSQVSLNRFDEMLRSLLSSKVRS